jgi:hypothetical protein
VQKLRTILGKRFEDTQAIVDFLITRRHSELAA